MFKAMEENCKDEKAYKIKRKEEKENGRICFHKRNVSCLFFRRKEGFPDV